MITPITSININGFEVPVFHENDAEKVNLQKPIYTIQPVQERDGKLYLTQEHSGPAEKYDHCADAIEELVYRQDEYDFNIALRPELNITGNLSRLQAGNCNKQVVRLYKMDAGIFAILRSRNPAIFFHTVEGGNDTEYHLRPNEFCEIRYALIDGMWETLPEDNWIYCTLADAIDAAFGFTGVEGFEGVRDEKLNKMLTQIKEAMPVAV
jgi:hypothetical protein